MSDTAQEMAQTHMHEQKVQMVDMLDRVLEFVDEDSQRKAEFAAFLAEEAKEKEEKRMTDPNKKPNGIKRMIREGELSDPCSIPELLEQCGRLLDKAYSHEILGEVMFEDNDGDIFVVTVEASIGVGNPKYVKEVLAEVAAEEEAERDWEESEGG